MQIINCFYKVCLTRLRPTIDSFKNNQLNSIYSVAISNPLLTVVLGDYVKSNHWYNSNTTAYGRSRNDGVTSQFWLQQSIKKPTNTDRASLSCRDLTFKSQPNLLMESAVHFRYNQPVIRQRLRNSFLKYKIHLPMNGKPNIERLMLIILDNQ